MKLTAVEELAHIAAIERAAGQSAAERRQSGIVHTPPALARFMARAADELMARELGFASGLFDPRVAIVDPACGPGVFAAALAAVREEHAREGAARVHAWDRDGAAIEGVREHLVGPLRACSVGVELRACDTLDDVQPEKAAELAEVMCVLGNPPWIGSVQPRAAAALERLMEDFRRDETGERLAERKLGVLADAYVRFLRWSCEVARHAQRASLLALVTNASYLDGPVHRGLRAALMRWFERLWIVDLGGSALLAGSGEPDENVFGVRPRVAILFAARPDGHVERSAAEVHYTRLRGSRKEKLERLSTARLTELPFDRIDPQPVQRRFLPGRPTDAEYRSWLSLAAAMPFHREGVQTNRDAVATDPDRSRLLQRLVAFARGEADAALSPALRAAPHYDPEQARAAVAEALVRDPDGSEGLAVRTLAYRPFETRWFAPIAPLCHRPRPDLLRAMDHSSFALVTVRKDRGEAAYHHVFATRSPIDNCLLSARSSCRARAFPTHGPDGAENIAAEVVAPFSERIGAQLSSADFALYALAVLASPRYRARYECELKTDYPRIPLPASDAAFREQVRIGAALLQLMTEPVLPLDAAGAQRSQLTLPLSAYRVGHHRPLEHARQKGIDAATLGALAARCERIETLLRSLS